MYRFIYAQKDSWIAETSSSQNFGGDEILEIRKEFNNNETGSKPVAFTRALIQFDLTPFKNDVDNGTIPDSAKYFLRMYSTETSALPFEYSLEAFPLSQSWEEGAGKLSSDPIVQDGVTWTHRDKRTTELSWSLAVTESYYNLQSTSGSRTDEGGLKGGGVWFTGSYHQASQSFSYESPDINMDISDIVKSHWYVSGSSEWNKGLIVKYSSSLESTSSLDRGNLKFFSRNTHTIYPPKLEVRWDDRSPITGSLTSSFTALDMSGTSDNYIYIKGLKPEYKETEVVKFRVGARKRYVDKTISTTYQTVTGSYVADTSGSYSIVDVITGETIVPFKDKQDNVYSYLSLDSGSMYFKQDLNTFQPNRVYKILIKVNYNDNQEIIYDDDYTFKIVR